MAISMRHVGISMDVFFKKTGNSEQPQNNELKFGDASETYVNKVTRGVLIILKTNIQNDFLRL